jgi:hypothetical protein
MEISVITSANLLLLNDIPIEELRLICKFFLKSLVTGSSTSEMDDKLETPLCALSIFLLEAGKLRATSETLRFATGLFESALKSW